MISLKNKCALESLKTLHRRPPSGLNTRADGCRPSEADSEPRVATRIVSQKVSHGVRPLDGVCEHGGVLRCCDVDSPQFLKKIACVDRKTQTVFGAAKVVGGWEEGRREWRRWGGPQR